MQVAFIVTINAEPGDVDGQGATRQLALAIFGNVTPVDEDGDGQDDYFILKDVTPEVRVNVWVGWHPSVANNIRDRYADLQNSALRQIAFAPPPVITRDYMIQRLKQFAMEHGCEGQWTVRPGDNLNVSSPADLLSRFVEF